MVCDMLAVDLLDGVVNIIGSLFIIYVVARLFRWCMYKQVELFVLMVKETRRYKEHIKKCLNEVKE